MNGHDRHVYASTPHLLDAETLNQFKKCLDCKQKPVVFITSELVPVCEGHWERLANSNIEW